MAETEEIVLTPEGYEQKKKKLEEYRKILYEELPKKLKLAKEHGAELRENKEYLDLRSEQDYYEAEVRRLEELLEKAVILDESQVDTKVVGLGLRVTLKDLKTNKTETFEMVSPAEADPEQNKISTESPVGRALMGQRKGAEIQVETPAGVLRYKIINIER
ncbi:MAG: transcription elongation factor GreA [Candidatus Bipolaricaulota bacterium]|nr:transcription elongation factor GreA [Candidatus Bipolaricaulota bacterium]MCS7275167.1 transcription elongation factor GreA [Candidatus Bipolaricaulota bacterium]MDW8110464.1 transcription elongation factor GreA [Candidatus Bipolaricaulota bacterium]MDW8329145.1 transcription elongation factor GreA [Candidatus Bipolaricaulota bacterium]